MAKISINALLEVSKMLATKAGQELSEALDFLNDLADQTVRILRQGITVQDNLNASTPTVELTHNTAQVVNFESSKQIFAVIPVRVISTQYGIDSFAWYLNAANQLVVKAGITGAPTERVSVTLIIWYR